ncbi:MAG: pyridoxal phosphate-dependent aminotransferase family protein [Calditrichaceae bacterium]|nr:pyridoxal phosphate-dependent aminotransferase family protein [Calditrichaceae bacterium]MBN2709139.1 pyridoxal phosphate-dependent aminotransferase family protein [Calditrichaceae bacterium]RQV96095.1 MAG: pyridoxal phosphate-dependent aminotransferase family protein [Calditrichota bacterium]
MDIFEKCRNFTRVRETIAAGIYPYFTPLTGNDGPRVHIDGREIIMIGSNNYLGLTHDPRVIEAALAATRQYGTSCSGSRFLNGTLDLHIKLEKKLAEFTKREAALIFSTGYMTNVGALSTIAGSNDYLIIDKSDHASIYAGIMAALRATIKRYNHNDMASLEQVLQQIPDDKGKLIISDGVFSMEGDIVKLDELVKLAQKYGARVYIDEAHALGVTGKTGKGTCELFNLYDEVDLVMSTFSKSLGSIGGFVAGPAEVISYLQHKASALIFSAAPTAATTATVLKILEIMEEEPEHVQRLQKISKMMQSEFKRIGFDTGVSKDTPIIPLYVRNDERTFLFWKKLFEAGIFANAVVSPAVPPDESIIRTSFMSTHSEDDLSKVLEIVTKVARDLSVI